MGFITYVTYFNPLCGYKCAVQVIHLKISLEYYLQCSIMETAQRFSQREVGINMEVMSACVVYKVKKMDGPTMIPKRTQKQFKYSYEVSDSFHSLHIYALIHEMYVVIWMLTVFR